MEQEDLHSTERTSATCSSPPCASNPNGRRPRDDLQPEHSPGRPKGTPHPDTPTPGERKAIEEQGTLRLSSTAQTGEDDENGNCLCGGYENKGDRTSAELRRRQRH